jgi:hypothetical protein
MLIIYMIRGKKSRAKKKKCCGFFKDFSKNSINAAYIEAHESCFDDVLLRGIH